MSVLKKMLLNPSNLKKGSFFDIDTGIAWFTSVTFIGHSFSSASLVLWWVLAIDVLDPFRRRVLRVINYSNKGFNYRFKFILCYFV
ncbi:MAG: hypothetical protein ACI9WS_003290 [Paraglaciecola psychrophila]